MASAKEHDMTRDFIGQPHDFDFLVGRWNVGNRRLRRRHAGSSDWEEFEATSQAWTHLDGIVSVDEIEFPTRGFSGCTVRTLDLATRRWSIYWINSRYGALFSPVHGGFAGDRGEFYGDDVDDGRRVQVRFVWTRGRDDARWEQAFSLGGDAWETNWVMELRRTA
jgi:hypothetical protein